MSAMRGLPRILVTFGTRPEAIKMFPVVTALRATGRFDVSVVVTAQHRELLDSPLLLKVTSDSKFLKVMNFDIPRDKFLRALEVFRSARSVLGKRWRRQARLCVLECSVSDGASFPIFEEKMRSFKAGKADAHWSEN